MCELHISKLVESATSLDIKTQDEVDLIALLHLATAVGAKQLETFLRHFLCVNYVAVSQRADFKLLDPEHAAFVEENQWPPKSYFASLDRYEEEHNAWAKRQKGGGSGSGGFLSRFFSFGKKPVASEAK